MFLQEKTKKFNLSEAISERDSESSQSTQKRRDNRPKGVKENVRASFFKRGV